MNQLAKASREPSLIEALAADGVMTRDELLSMPLGTRILFVPALEQKFKEAAIAMAADEFTRPHLREKPDACFRVIRMALNWRMDYERVAAATYSPAPGEIGIEGKLAAGVMLGTGVVVELQHELGPSPEDWSRVSGKFKMEQAKWPDGNPKFRKNNRTGKYDGPPIMVQVPTYTREDEEGLYLISTAIMHDGREVSSPKIFLTSCHPRNSMQWNTRPDAQIINVGIRWLFNNATPQLSMGVHVDTGLQQDFHRPDDDEREMRDVTPPRGDVDLEAEGVRGAGETAPGTAAGMAEGVDYDHVEKEMAKETPPAKEQPVNTGRGGRRKRIAVQFRGKETTKTGFLRDAKQLLNDVDDEEDFERLAGEIKAAIESVDDAKEAAKIRGDIWPAVEEVKADFEAGEIDETEQDEAPPAAAAAPAQDPGEFDLAMD